jgi:hypothetical protein
MAERISKQHKLWLGKATGKILGRFRCENGYTFESAASNANIDAHRWKEIEEGKVLPTVEVLARCLYGIGLTWEKFGIALDAAVRGD